MRTNWARHTRGTSPRLPFAAGSRGCSRAWAHYASRPPHHTARKLVRAAGWLLGIFGLWVSLWGVTGCSTESECRNQSCVCVAGANCKFDCEAPPCHIECRGDNDECSGACANGECSCGKHSNCDFSCDAPPCHVDCADSTTCGGTCANGSCTCGDDATCSFECSAGPCHVTCGRGAHCNGECANGTCQCGPNGNCEFTCNDGNCKTRCPSGAQCLLRCEANTPDCAFDECGSAVTQCADGVLACGRDCPAQ